MDCGSNPLLIHNTTFSRTFSTVSHYPLPNQKAALHQTITIMPTTSVKHTAITSLMHRVHFCWCRVAPFPKNREMRQREKTSEQNHPKTNKQDINRQCVPTWHYRNTGTTFARCLHFFFGCIWLILMERQLERVVETWTMTGTRRVNMDVYQPFDPSSWKPVGTS